MHVCSVCIKEAIPEAEKLNISWYANYEFYFEVI